MERRKIDGANVGGHIASVALFVVIVSTCHMRGKRDKKRRGKSRKAFTMAGLVSGSWICKVYTWQ